MKYSIAFSIVIVLSNYLFQFQINNWLTWGAVLFPFSFLLTDIISEKFGKEYTLKMVRNGILIAFIPTFLMVDVRIAAASIIAYIISQIADVYIFDILKNKYNKKWWVRNNVSTLISQTLDTLVFFMIAFYGVMPNELMISLIVGTCLIKWVMALIDTPLFYFIAIKDKK